MATQQIKDILDTEFPNPSWVWNPSKANPLTTELEGNFSRPSVGYTLNPRSGIFEEKAADEPRIYGGSEGLLMGPEARNYVPDSSSITEAKSWSGDSTHNLGPKPSVIEGGTAYQWEGDVGRVSQKNAGTTTGGGEHAYAIVETYGTEEVEIQVDERETPSYIARASYNFSNDNLTLRNYAVDGQARKVFDIGPNGGEVWIIEMEYDSSKGGNLSAGTGRGFFINPDSTGNGNNTILHHGQVINFHEFVPPIRNSSSTTEVSKDNLRIKNPDQYDWINNREQTWVLEVRLITENAKYTDILKAEGSNDRLELNRNSSGVGFYDNGQSTFKAKVSDETIPLRQRSKFALTVTEKEVRISYNGIVDESSYSGDFVDTFGTDYLFRSSSGLVYDRVVHYPTAFTTKQHEIITGG